MTGDALRRMLDREEAYATRLPFERLFGCTLDEELCPPAKEGLRQLRKQWPRIDYRDDISIAYILNRITFGELSILDIGVRTIVYYDYLNKKVGAGVVFWHLTRNHIIGEHPFYILAVD